MTVVNATSLQQALEALRDHPGARLVQGGTDVMVEVNFNRTTLHDVVALRRVNELRRWHVSEDSQTIRLGAGVPYAEMERSPLCHHLPALAQAARTVGSPQIRAAGSLGGNLGTCSPAGDGLPVLSALDATVHLQSLDASRDLSIHEFMLGVKKNARQPDEVIVAVTVPILDGFQGYAKVGTRNAMVISAASACVVHDALGATVRVALGAVAPTVVRTREAEAWLASQTNLAAPLTVTTELAREFGRRAAAECSPIDDHRSTAAYRRHAIAVLVERLLLRANDHGTSPR
ncbi:MAG: FAD binding domain-containing protein [Ilumatobacteraceae bacterium]|jgi:CO/xanthine dehydrogenase FAD-binding subunit